MRAGRLGWRGVLLMAAERLYGGERTAREKMKSAAASALAMRRRAEAVDESESESESYGSRTLRGQSGSKSRTAGYVDGRIESGLADRLNGRGVLALQDGEDDLKGGDEKENHLMRNSTSTHMDIGSVL